MQPGKSQAGVLRCMTMDYLHGIAGLLKSTFNIDTVEHKKQLDRLTICFGCDQRNNARCRKCGCFLKAKTKLLAERCPLDKW